MNKLTPVKEKTAKGFLTGRPYRFGTVDGNIWVEHVSNYVAVYDTGLKQITGYKWTEIREFNTAQQVSANDVMITTDYGLHVVNTVGKYRYKIVNGTFSDISVNINGKVAVINYKQNKVMFLCKKENKWQILRQVSFLDNWDRSIKTLVWSGDVMFVVTLVTKRMLKVNAQTGEILQRYGRSTISRPVGVLNVPTASAVDSFDCVIVSDVKNGHFLVLYPDGNLKVTKVNGVNGIRDFIVLGNFVVTLSRGELSPRNYKLSKFQIN